MFEELSRKLEKPKTDTTLRKIAPKEVKYVKQCLMAYASAEQVSCIGREDLLKSDFIHMVAHLRYIP